MSRTPPPLPSVPPTAEPPRIGVGIQPDDDGFPHMVVIRVGGVMVAMIPDMADHVAEQLAAAADRCRKPKIVLSS